MDLRIRSFEHQVAAPGLFVLASRIGQLVVEVSALRAECASTETPAQRFVVDRSSCIMSACSARWEYACESAWSLRQTDRPEKDLGVYRDGAGASAGKATSTAERMHSSA
jgi:hypothetical protein